jgi:hypothetical protein
LSLFSELPVRRLEIRFGKLSIVDFFDLNNYGTDSNFQFMNWTIDNNGVYDYAADTRGFTFSATLEYHDPHWAVRFAEGLMPKVANGIHLDADPSRARSENIEVELHGSVLGEREGTLRLLTFVNHANMGRYREAVDNFLAGLTPKPVITAHRLQSTTKYGFGVTFEQPLNVTGWEPSDAGAGMKANTNRMLTPKWTKLRSWGSVETERDGNETSTEPASRSVRTEFHETTNGTWHSLAMASYWGTDSSTTDVKTSWRPITLCTLGGESTLRSIFSTWITPATTETAALFSFPACGCI